MFNLTYKGSKYFPKDFTQEIEISESDVVFKEAFQFCQQWFNGENTFTLHTSGSTGKPKAIQVSRAQMIASAKNTCEFLKIDDTDTALISLNPAYIAGKMMLVRAMEFGFTAILIHPNIADIISHIQEVEFTLFAFVPLQLNSIFEIQMHGNLKKAKAILLGGAAIHNSLEQKIQEEALPVYQTFGMTETVSHIALRNVLKDDFYEILPNVSIKKDERGCLMVKGEVTQGEWIVSNDLIETIDDRHFRWIGRVDNVINTGGVKVQLEAVERVINAFLFQVFETDIEFVVVSIPDTLLGEKVCLMIEISPLLKTIEENLKSFIRKEVNRYAAPKLISYVTSIPKTPTQKVDRVKVKEFFISE